MEKTELETASYCKVGDIYESPLEKQKINTSYYPHEGMSKLTCKL